MGWTTYNISKTTTTDQALRRELSYAGTAGLWEVLDSATVGAVWYGIIKRTIDGEAVHFGMVCLTQRSNNYPRSLYIEFGFKEMTEDCGPFYYDAPLRILDKLDELAPNPAPAAAAWRAQCRERRAAKAAKERQRREMRAQLAKYIPQQFKGVTHG
jgi:hypothetical protein